MIVRLNGDVPASSGLGWSAALRVGLLPALNELTRAGLGKHRRVELATELEHYPDNAAPATLGGLTAAGFVEGGVRCLRFAVGMRLKFVALIPLYQVSPVKARQLVPPMFSRADTLHNLKAGQRLSVPRLPHVNTTHCAACSKTVSSSPNTSSLCRN